MPRVVISKADDAGMVAALRFVQEIYKKEFNTEPQHLWPDCLIAVRDGIVVGVTAMQFSSGKPFEIEEQFHFNTGILPADRTEIVSFGKWVTSIPEISSSLVLAATSFALSRGCTRSLSCAKPRLLEFLRIKHHLRFDVFNVRPNLANIPEEDRNFFITDPLPKVYSANLQEWYDILKENTSSSVEIRL